MKKTLTLLACLLLACTNGLLLAGKSPIPEQTPWISLALSLLLLILALLPAAKAPAAPAAAASALPPSRDERSRHELAALLGMLQEKGRLVDFVMEDITAQPDARVGQVARIVHAGCRDVIQKAFDPAPALAGTEGQTLTLDPAIPPERCRLVGAAPAEPPRSGKLLHRGWLAGKVELPEFSREPVTRPDGYLIAPAELELS